MNSLFLSHHPTPMLGAIFGGSTWLLADCTLISVFIVAVSILSLGSHAKVAANRRPYIGVGIVLAWVLIAVGSPFTPSFWASAVIIVGAVVGGFLIILLALTARRGELWDIAMTGVMSLSISLAATLATPLVSTPHSRDLMAAFVVGGFVTGALMIDLIFLLLSRTARLGEDEPPPSDLEKFVEIISHRPVKAARHHTPRTHRHKGGHSSQSR